jgi:hypothetical protein
MLPKMAQKGLGVKVTSLGACGLTAGFQLVFLISPAVGVFVHQPEE